MLNPEWRIRMGDIPEVVEVEGSPQVKEFDGLVAEHAELKNVDATVGSVSHSLTYAFGERYKRLDVMVLIVGDYRAANRRVELSVAVNGVSKTVETRFDESGVAGCVIEFGYVGETVNVSVTASFGQSLHIHTVELRVAAYREPVLPEPDEVRVVRRDGPFEIVSLYRFDLVPVGGTPYLDGREADEVVEDELGRHYVFYTTNPRPRLTFDSPMAVLRKAFVSTDVRIRIRDSGMMLLYAIARSRAISVKLRRLGATVTVSGTVALPRLFRAEDSVSTISAVMLSDGDTEVSGNIFYAYYVLVSRSFVDLSRYGLSVASESGGGYPSR